MLKTQVDPTISMKTQGRATECPSTKRAYLHENAAPASENRQKSEAKRNADWTAFWG
jgi:hypothetical protein